MIRSTSPSASTLASIRATSSRQDAVPTFTWTCRKPAASACAQRSRVSSSERDPDTGVKLELLLPDPAEEVADAPARLLAEQIPAGDVERRLRIGVTAHRRLHARVDSLDLARVAAEDRPAERLEDGTGARPEAGEEARREDALLSPADVATVGLDPYHRRVLLCGDASAGHCERPARVRVAHGIDVDPPDPARVGHRGTIAAIDAQVTLYTLNTEARTPT